jgi:uncharacterized cupin superfamily protein
MPKIDPASAPTKVGSGYPAPFHETGMAKHRVRLGDAAGLTQFGVNLMTLQPGAWSSQRHWHEGEDEFVLVISGEVVLVDDGGETVLRAGDSAGFKAGAPNGHHLQNRSQAPAVVLEVGGRAPQVDVCHYSDIDLHLPAGCPGYVHKDGTPY